MVRSIVVALYFAVPVLWLCYDRKNLRALIEGINNFRGGPPPTHPSPAGDTALFRPWKKRARVTKP